MIIKLQANLKSNRSIDNLGKVKGMRIGDVSERTGIPASTIRYYERIGVLPEPERANGQRVYEAQVLEYLRAISIAKELGFTLEEIALLLGTFRSGENPSETCRVMAREKLSELDELIHRARQMKQILEHGLKCTCSSLSGCYVTRGEP